MGALFVVTCDQVLSSRPMQMVACSYKRIEPISASQLRKDLCGSFASKWCRKKTGITMSIYAFEIVEDVKQVGEAIAKFA